MFHQRVIHLAPGGNDFTKGAAKLAAVRFRVKEMTGGLEWWQNKEGYPVAMGPAPGGL